ncbi:MAG: hypothetical protein FJ088_08860 [Deltaproteobacteria bacterium]|nr:hypothetical protein [Deltaproteobacteria bacterium]
MAGCCGGKDAGKPITGRKYYIGMALFVMYHLFVQTLLLVLSLFVKKYRKITKFHRIYFSHVLDEIKSKKGITIAGRGAECKTGEI